MIEEFRRVGNVLFLKGLVHSHSGNMSKKEGECIIITKRGASLFELREEDIVKVCMKGDVPPSVSVEYKVHRMIYKEINCKGIIHAHPSYTVALSFFLPQILPKDMEGQYFFESVPVLSSVKEQEFLDALAREHIVVLRGHGTFAAGNSLDEALLYTCALESSARLIYLCSIYERRGNDKL